MLTKAKEHPHGIHLPRTIHKGDDRANDFHHEGVAMTLLCSCGNIIVDGLLGLASGNTLGSLQLPLQLKVRQQIRKIWEQYTNLAAFDQYTPQQYAVGQTDDEQE